MCCKLGHSIKTSCNPLHFFLSKVLCCFLNGPYERETSGGGAAIGGRAEETSILAKCHKYNVTTDEPPLPKCVAVPDSGIQQLNTEIWEEVRLKAIGIIYSNDHHRREQNLTFHETKALRNLQGKTKASQTCQWTRATKLLTLNMQDYEEKASTLLDSQDFEKLNNDPTTRTQSELNKIT